MADQNLQSIGQTLRQARERRGLSIEQVERETRIRARFLVAMENGDISDIPSHVQARGFIYNYAQYLTLNPADVIASFDALYSTQLPTTLTAQSTPDAPIAAPPQQPPASAPPPPAPSRYSTQVFQTQPLSPPAAPEENDFAPPAQPSLAGRLISSDLFLISILALVAVLVLGIGGRALRNLPTNGTNTEQSAFLESLNDSQTSTATATFAPTSTPTVTPPLLTQDRVRLTFEVVQRNWMRVDVDGETVFAGLSEPGTLLQYEGADTVRVITGNGAAIDVTYNGRKIGLLGQQGFIAEQIYTLGGLETLTPTPTPTVTPTPIPTATGTPGPTATASTTATASATP